MYEWDYYKTNKFNWEQNLFSSSKNIFVYETTKQIAQVKTVANIINKISLDNTNTIKAIGSNIDVPLNFETKGGGDFTFVGGID